MDALDWQEPGRRHLILILNGRIPEPGADRADGQVLALLLNAASEPLAIRLPVLPGLAAGPS